MDRPVKRLLVVEDDEAARESIVELIGDGDVQTTTVGTGEEALAGSSRSTSTAWCSTWACPT